MELWKAEEGTQFPVAPFPTDWTLHPLGSRKIRQFRLRWTLEAWSSVGSPWLWGHMSLPRICCPVSWGLLFTFSELHFPHLKWGTNPFPTALFWETYYLAWFPAHRECSKTIDDDDGDRIMLLSYQLMEAFQHPDPKPMHMSTSSILFG